MGSLASLGSWVLAPEGSTEPWNLKPSICGLLVCCDSGRRCIQWDATEMQEGSAEPVALEKLGGA